ncbi:MAG: tetratricopeptide repeat protein [Saprospiraceae bacterium]|nr:tetratricopeptide repeat protein [Saprospiraceae bacterium]
MKKGRTPSVESKKNIPIQNSSFVWFKWPEWVVFFVGSVIYLNTIGHDFTQDDAIVIYDNMYTTQGLSGLKGLFTKDTFFGFFKEEGKAKLVSGGRYRPFTPAMFAMEYQLVGKNPWLGHLMNILFYGLLCLMVYKILMRLICHRDDDERKKFLVLVAALIFAAHPIHTEAVANIKGRDEIMSMLGSILAMFYIFKYYDDGRKKYLFLAGISFFIALLSKENTITFLAVIPLALYYFRDAKFIVALKKSATLLVPTFIFLFIRSLILGNDFGGTPMELMNNPYLKLVNGSYIPFDMGEKLATIIYTLGKYIQLLVFPHPLTHDYYPRHIGMKSFSDAYVLFSLAAYILIALLAVKGLRKRTIPGFASAYYLATLSIVSNLVFPIGTNMSERFMFMPSLGFALMLSYLLVNLVYDKLGKNAFLITIGTIMSLYAIKTVTRNNVWKSDFSLFTTDVKTSGNSAKVLNAAGGALTTEAFAEKDDVKKREMLNQALIYLNKAVDVHPQYKNAYLIMGNAYYYLQEFEKGAAAYQKALELDPNFKDASTNLAVTLRDAGRKAGEKENNLVKAESYLTRSYQLSPNDSETLRLLGVMYGIKNDHLNAIKYFEKAALIDTLNAGLFLNLSMAYRNIGNITNGEMYLKKALSIDPEIINKQSAQ